MLLLGRADNPDVGGDEGLTIHTYILKYFGFLTGAVSYTTDTNLPLKRK